MSKEIESHILDIFEIKTFLGSGAYGHVWKVVHRENGKDYALKKIFDAFQNDVDAQRTYRQVTILHQLEHENIIKLHWVIKAHNGRDLYLVFDFMEADLHSILGENLLGPTHIRFITFQLCKVLKYLHSAQLIHRDLKSSNILVNSNCEVKICDFGLVRSLIHEEDTKLILSEDIATRWYRSPEMLLGSQKYGKSTDMWSLGCILAQLVTGDPIFPGSSTINQIERVLEFTGLPSKQNVQALESQSAYELLNSLKIRKRPLKSYLGQCDNEVRELIMRMLEFNPQKRITAQQALQLPSLQEFRGKTRQNYCNKFIMTQIDDNNRLTLEQYRKIIYRDIDRRYPTVNNISAITIPRIYRSHNSLLSKTNVQIKRMAANSLFKTQQQKFASIHKSNQEVQVEDSHINKKRYFRKINKPHKQQKQNQFESLYTSTNQSLHEHILNSKISKKRIRQNFWGKKQKSCFNQ